ncbi:MAG TPA: hypothetical protein VIJ93_12655 [bacterium]
MLKSAKKNSNFIDDPRRCDICSTTLTLYPKDFATCPHCQRAICRPCWADVWASKSFPAETCAHLMMPGDLSMAGIVEKKRGLSWDWQKGIFVLVLGLGAIGTLVFLFNLFIF